MLSNFTGEWVGIYIGGPLLISKSSQRTIVQPEQAQDLQQEMLNYLKPLLEEGLSLLAVCPQPCLFHFK